jgi:hypothetical protein
MVPGVLSPGVKRGQGVTLTIHPPLVPRSRMSRSYTSSPSCVSIGVLWDCFIFYLHSVPLTSVGISGVCRASLNKIFTAAMSIFYSTSHYVFFSIPCYFIPNVFCIQWLSIFIFPQGGLPYYMGSIILSLKRFLARCGWIQFNVQPRTCPISGETGIIKQADSMNKARKHNGVLFIPNLLEAVPWFRSLVASLSPRRTGFAPGSIHVGFVVDKGALAQVFLRVLQFFPVNISFHRRSPNTYHLENA